MRVVPLTAAPNQAFTVTLDNVRWVLRVFSVPGAMAVDVARDGVPILSGTRLLAGEAIIPYRYLENGNFVMLTSSDELPQWENFGVSQTLVYVSAAELAVIYANPLTVGDVTLTSVTFLTDDDGFYLTTDTGELLTDD